MATWTPLLRHARIQMSCQDLNGALPTHPAGVTEDLFSTEIFDSWAWIPQRVVSKEICYE
jgi:hypothetical protein